LIIIIIISFGLFLRILHLVGFNVKKKQLTHQRLSMLPVTPSSYSSILLMYVRDSLSNPVGSIHFYRYTAQHMKKSRVWHLKMAANTKMGARKQCAQQCIQRTFLARVEPNNMSHFIRIGPTIKLLTIERHIRVIDPIPSHLKFPPTRTM
jgi:hypothetical protein